MTLLAEIDRAVALQPLATTKATLLCAGDEVMSAIVRLATEPTREYMRELVAAWTRACILVDGNKPKSAA